MPALLPELVVPFKRPIYAGNAIVTVEVPQDRKVIGTVRDITGAGGPTGVIPPSGEFCLDVPLPGQKSRLDIAGGELVCAIAGFLLAKASQRWNELLHERFDVGPGRLAHQPAARIRYSSSS